MIYNSADDIPEEQRRELITGLSLLGAKLREWRHYGGLHTLTAEVLNADGVIVVKCNSDDTITLKDGGNVLDISDLLEQP